MMRLERRNGVLADGQQLTFSALPSSSSRGNSSGSRRYHSGSSLREDTLKANLRRTHDSSERQHTSGTSKSAKSSISESATTSSTFSPSQTSSRKPQRRKAHKLTVDTSRHASGPSAHQDQSVANSFLRESNCIVESPTGLIYASPKARFCDGLTCHTRQHEEEHIALADVVSTMPLTSHRPKLNRLDTVFRYACLLHKTARKLGRITKAVP